MPDAPEAPSPEEPAVPPPKVADRIRKLLALKTSSNMHEAEAAALMAARLMQRHKLTEADVSEEVGEGSKLVDVPVGAEGFQQDWKFALITVVARAMFCEAIALVSAGRRKVRLIGKLDDTAATIELYRFLVKEIERLASVEERDPFVAMASLYEEMEGRRGGRRGYMDAFKKGAAFGVGDKLRLDMERLARSSEKAMVLVRNARSENLDYMKHKFGDPQVTMAGRSSGLAAEMAFARGYDQGSELDAGLGRRAPEAKLIVDEPSATRPAPPPASESAFEAVMSTDFSSPPIDVYPVDDEAVFGESNIAPTSPSTDEKQPAEVSPTDAEQD